MAKFIANSFTAKSADNFQLDAGMLVTGLDMASFDGNISSLAENQKIGATTGGGSIEIKPEMRDLFEDVDNVTQQYMEGMIIDKYEANLKMTILEFKEGNLMMALGAAEKNANSYSSTHYDAISPKISLDADDFKTVYWLATIKGSDKPIVIEIKNAINKNGFNLSFETKGKGKIELELSALGTLKKPNEMPITIYLPKAGEA